LITWRRAKNYGHQGYLFCRNGATRSARERNRSSTELICTKHFVQRSENLIFRTHNESNSRPPQFGIKCAEIHATLVRTNADFGQAPKKETVYQGPTDQTIHNGAPAAQPAPAMAVATPGAVSPAVRGGASWFYWIGVLSLINTVLTLSVRISISSSG